MDKGKVYLTGAGPGDENLLTLKAAEVLKKCNVVIHDYLSGTIDLEKYAPQATKIYVGKRGHHQATDQKSINELMIKMAKEGKEVVRLKGGDPFVFGRGGEEALALVKAGVEYEVVPGVSSVYAVPAYAGIPLTQRNYTSSLAIVTGQEGSKERSDINWQALAQTFGTIVFLMGVKNLSLIAKKLIKFGKKPTTPVALIRWGTTARQQVLEGTLADIADKASLTKFKAPAIIVVGEVASLRKELLWFEKKPLFGKTIVVTRSSNQAGKLSDALKALGASTIEIPTIKVEPPDSYKKLDKAIERQIPGQYYNWLIFTSANGVNYFTDYLKRRNIDMRIFKGVKIAAVGKETAASLESLALQVDLIPTEFKAEGLLKAIGEVKGLNILIPRAKVARNILPEQLRKSGATVDVVDTYQTQIDEQGVKKADLLDERVDMVTFTSGSAIMNFLKILGERKDSFFDSVKVAVIGPVTAKIANKNGIKVDIVAKDYTIAGLVKAIVDESGVAEYAQTV